MSIRRTLTSPTVVAELRQKIYGANHQQQPPFGDLLKRIEQFFDRALLYIWLTVIVSMPLVLVALVVGLGNFTVEWLYVAGSTLLMTLTYLAVLHGLYDVNSLAAGNTRAIKGIIGSLSVLLSIGLVGWVIGAPKARPPSPLDIQLALFSGFWFAAWLTGVAIHSLVTDKEASRTLRLVSLISTLSYSIWIILTACSFAWSWSSRADMRLWTNVQSNMSGLVVGFSLITTYLRQPPKAVSDSERKRIVRVRRIAVIAIVVFLMTWALTIKW